MRVLMRAWEERTGDAELGPFDGPDLAEVGWKPGQPDVRPDAGAPVVDGDGPDHLRAPQNFEVRLHQLIQNHRGCPPLSEHTATRHARDFWFISCCPLLSLPIPLPLVC